MIEKVIIIVVVLKVLIVCDLYDHNTISEHLKNDHKQLKQLLDLS